MNERCVKVDSSGYYARWSSEGKEYETLRTKSQAKAELWLFRGNCHGASAHDKTCPQCEHITEDTFKIPQTKVEGIPNIYRAEARDHAYRRGARFYRYSLIEGTGQYRWEHRHAIRREDGRVPFHELEYYFDENGKEVGYYNEPCSALSWISRPYGDHLKMTDPMPLQDPDRF